MPDYRRILSYLYRYENGERKECTGFVKAEQRKQSLKLMIQIKDPLWQEEVQMLLLFYKKKQDSWEITRSDLMEPKDGEEGGLLFYEKATVPDGFDIQDQYGIIICHQDRLRYGSVWIGEEIPTDCHIQNQDSETPAGPLPQPDNMESEETNTTVVSETKLTTEREIKATEGTETNGTVEPETKAIEETETKAAEESETKVTEEIEIKATEESETEAIAEPETKAELKPVQSELSSELSMTQSELMQDRLTQSEETESDGPVILPDLLQPLRDQAPKAEKIFNSAFYEGYEISPSQLVHLGEEADLLAVNQFLLKGFGRYDHLLAAKVLYNGEDRYCIGVPGMYENREKYMARLYQFPVFLSLSENRIKTGRYGYWLHMLS